MSQTTRAYLEHTAFRVRDIHWHIRFFQTVFGWTIRQIDGDATDPKQVWIGGMQLMAAPDFDGSEGRVNHVGIRCEDVDRAVAVAFTFEGVTHLAKGRQWLVLPEGMIVELLPASESAVVTALSIDPQM
ncbi:MAG: VOC family protein [Bosea sp. (in: a-proteobacteria)]